MAGTCKCGCGEPVRQGRQYIHGHNRRKAPSYTVDPTTGCWLWDHHTSDKGYGQLRERSSGRTIKAHRYFYELHRGPIPDGLHLDHLCRNPRCVNPDHLEPVTNGENQRRGIRTKLTPDDVVAIRASSEQSSVLAARYGVTHRYINDLRAGRKHAWRDLPVAV